MRFLLFTLLLLVYHNGSTQYSQPETNQNNEYYIKVLERKIKMMNDTIHKLEKIVKKKEEIIDPLSDESDLLKDSVEKYQNDFTVSRRTLIQYIKDLQLENSVLEDSLYLAKKNLTTAKRIMLTENAEKKAWIKVTVGAIVLFTGIAIAVSTGLWIPVFMGVAAIEIFLLVEGNYRLSIDDLKKLEQEEKRIKI